MLTVKRFFGSVKIKVVDESAIEFMVETSKTGVIGNGNAGAFGGTLLLEP